jgi:DUF218 domain
MPFVKKAVWGLFEYQCSWGLTLNGLLLLLFIFCSIVVVIFIKIYPFFAIFKPVDADVLVVEGWADDVVLIQALNEFKQRKYTKLVVTGTVLSKGGFLSSYKNHAEMAAATLSKLGCPTNQIMIIPTPEVKIDRTLASAIEVKKRLLESLDSIKGVNIYSYDVHTRRSWLLFKKVLQPEIPKVGAIAYITDSYNTSSWWKSSEGVKVILLETISYFYYLLKGQF